MDLSTPTPTDPVALVQQLHAKAIRKRLDALDRERAALRVLLRAALRNQHTDSTPAPTGGGPHAA
jgi:hypothetical protein